MQTPKLRNPHDAQPGRSHTGSDPGYVRTQSQDPGATDPYAQVQHHPDNTLCTGCGLLYRGQRWVRDPEQAALIQSAGVATEVLCPACRQSRDQLPRGIVRLQGEYWPQHRAEIMNLIRNEEAETAEDNPLARVLSVHEEDGALVLTTTNEKLAQCIGRSIHHAHHGEVEYDWSDGERLVRVNWQR